MPVWGFGALGFGVWGFRVWALGFRAKFRVCLGTEISQFVSRLYDEGFVQVL